MAGVMRRYLKMLFSTGRKQTTNAEGDSRRITARLPVLNGADFDEEGREDTVRQTAVVKASKETDHESKQERSGNQNAPTFRLLREISFLHSDVEIP